jgi:hypothetical protein
VRASLFILNFLELVHDFTRHVVDSALAYQAVVTSYLISLIGMCTSCKTSKLLLMQGAVYQSDCLRTLRIVQCYLLRCAVRSISSIFISQRFINHKSITPCSAEKWIPKTIKTSDLLPFPRKPRRTSKIRLCQK